MHVYTYQSDTTRFMMNTRGIKVTAPWWTSNEVYLKIVRAISCIYAAACRKNNVYKLNINVD